MAEIKVFVDKAFVSTGHNIITEDYMVDVPTKGTLLLTGMSQGDAYARYLDVYSDGVVKYHNVVANSFSIQVNLGALTQGRHTVGVELTTFVGSWIVNGTVVLDTVEVPEITPFIPAEQTTLSEPEITPNVTVSGPAVVVPPETDIPTPAQDVPVEGGLMNWLTMPSAQLIPTQAQIDAQGKQLAQIRASVEDAIPHVTYIDMIVPSQDFIQSNSIPLSVNAVNDRLKDIPTGNLPQFDFPSGTLGSPEYGPTELSYLASSFHKDNFGRDVFTAGNFSAETNMILLGAGVAALIAGLAYYKRDALVKLIKR